VQKILGGPSGSIGSVGGGSDTAGSKTGATEPVTPAPVSPARIDDGPGEQRAGGIAALAGIGTDFQVADVFTKPLAHSKFASFRNVLCGYRTFENLMNSNAEKTAEIRRLCALEFRLLETAGLDGHSLQRYI